MVKNLIVSSSNWLVAVTGCEALVVPTVTLPKLSAVGVASRSPVSLLSSHANAGLGLARPISRRRAKVKTENAKMDDFCRDMVNPPKSRTARNERPRTRPTLTLFPPRNDLLIAAKLGKCFN
jgi:hypothetical protein